MKIIKGEIVEVERERVIAIKCDKCKVRYNDPMEIQEFLFINFTGGYNSIFGDMNKVEGDICQHCLKKVLGHYLRITEYELPF